MEAVAPVAGTARPGGIVSQTLSQDQQASETREELLRRYAGGGAPSKGWRLRFQLKQFAWVSVVTATRVAKRILDVFGSITLAIALAPLFLVVIALIRFESRGAILFAQQRVGRHGRLFKMFKFRSMYIDAEQRKAALMPTNEMEGGVIFKMKDDPRITKVGKYVRRGSIDELPQLWNVFKGEMSLVGPRPPLPAEVAEYSLEDRRRLEVVPGITCIWQVSGRSEIPFDQQVALDVGYIESQSVWLDLKLLLRTVPAVLLGKGAY